MRRAPLVRLLGLAAIFGGALHALKGAVLLLADRDLSLVPTFSLLFGIGLAGLYLRLHGRARVLGLLGLAAAAVVVVAALVALAYQAREGVAPEFEGSPLGVRAAYAAATIGIFVSFLLLAIATVRARVVDAPWRYIPLAAAVAWFPLEGLTAVLPDGWGLLFAGLAWIAAALVIVAAPERDAGSAGVART